MRLLSLRCLLRKAVWCGKIICADISSVTFYTDSLSCVSRFVTRATVIVDYCHAYCLISIEKFYCFCWITFFDVFKVIGYFKSLSRYER
ncbi:hypothetical protein Sarmat_00413 [Rickettsiales endosymbiont of Paramecium tredecaurelia]|nr:hypothetical protein [Candidatus Sarmatiella mevalonica]